MQKDVIKAMTETWMLGLKVMFLGLAIVFMVLALLFAIITALRRFLPYSKKLVKQIAG